MTFEQDIKRGDIFYAKLGEKDQMGNEQKGYRPVLVVQNDLGNEHSGVIIVSLITSRKKTELPTHLEVHMDSLKDDSIVMLEHLRTISRERFGKKIGVLPKHKLKELDNRLGVSVGIFPIEILHKRKPNVEVKEEEETNRCVDCNNIVKKTESFFGGRQVTYFTCKDNDEEIANIFSTDKCPMYEKGGM